MGRAQWDGYVPLCPNVNVVVGPLCFRARAWMVYSKNEAGSRVLKPELTVMIMTLRTNVGAV